MRVVVTGTPGTGKTTATEHLETDLDVVHLNDVVKDEELFTERDEARDSLVADMDALVEKYADADDVLVESHLAHYLADVDAVVVLRCDPVTLEGRLTERGEPEQKARENAESEALDVILSEAVQRHGEERVYEIDTTDRTPADVAAEIDAVIRGEREPSAGEVDFTEYLL